MPSLQQIEANRRNAQRSTGPRTAEGKAVSRYNAVDSGLYADREVVLPVEDPHALDLLTTEYFERFNPRTPEQRCLVDCLVSDEWLMRRFRRIEGELMTRSNKDVKGSQERFCLAGAYEQNGRALDRLQRRINGTRRSYLKTLESLNRLQTMEEEKRAAHEQAMREEVLAERAALAQTAEPAVEDAPLPPAIGFVPSQPREDSPLPSARLALRL